MVISARGRQRNDVLAHEVSAQGTIYPTDLSEMLFNQIGARSVILQVPDGARIIDHLVVVGVFNFLLKL